MSSVCSLGVFSDQDIAERESREPVLAIEQVLRVPAGAVEVGDGAGG